MWCFTEYNCCYRWYVTCSCATCCCNGNPVLRELSINLLLTVGSVRPLKIEDIHWRSLGLGLGLDIHCWLTADKVPWSIRQQSQRAGGFYIEVAFSLVKQLICAHTCSLSCCASCRMTEQAETYTAPLSCISQTLLRNTSDVDGNQRPHSFVWQTEVYFFFSANVTVAHPSSTQTRHGTTHMPPALTKADVAPKHHSQGERMWEVMNEWHNVSMS